MGTRLAVGYRSGLTPVSSSFVPVALYVDRSPELLSPPGYIYAALFFLQKFWKITENLNSRENIGWSANSPVIVAFRTDLKCYVYLGNVFETY